MNAPIPVEAWHKSEGVLGHLQFNTMSFKKRGDFISPHAHAFDHVTIIIRGPLLCRTQKSEKQLMEGERVLIRAGVEHEFIAQADNCLAYCVHNHDVVLGRME